MVAEMGVDFNCTDRGGLQDYISAYISILWKCKISKWFNSHDEQKQIFHLKITLVIYVNKVSWLWWSLKWTVIKHSGQDPWLQNNANLKLNSDISKNEKCIFQWKDHQSVQLVSSRPLTCLLRCAMCQIPCKLNEIDRWEWEMSLKYSILIGGRNVINEILFH